jgi:hypothetical protein
LPAPCQNLLVTYSVEKIYKSHLAYLGCHYNEMEYVAAEVNKYTVPLL